MPTANPERKPPVLVVALLGGESTGKSTLASDLKAALQLRGVAAAWVPEHLRTWCSTHGRAPHQPEQRAVAAEQGDQITAAVHSTPPVRVVIADTTPLVVAAYSELYFQDTTLYPAALAWQQGADLNLLMGLDLPWTPDGLFRDGPGFRERTDELLRQQLQAAALPFHTVYGWGPARLLAALRIVEQALNTPLCPMNTALERGTTAWSCERCSDPDCERRLFTRLL